jgi:predicted ATPase/class 3 adenylate cyclase
MTADIFISYSSRDVLTATAICKALEEAGCSCWIAPRNILPGQTWTEAIIDGINASQVMVLLYSAASNASPQVLREIERAVSKRLGLIAFRVEDVPLSKAMEYLISVTHWHDATTGPLEIHLARLVESVQAMLAARGVVVEPPLHHVAIPASNPPIRPEDRQAVSAGELGGSEAATSVVDRAVLTPSAFEPKSTPHPVGTVTLLFTDIEGSTRLWEEHPAKMRVALARNDELISQVIERHHGYVFKTIGGAFCAAFSMPSDGLNAALDAQHVLAAEPWPDPIHIRVRMALHTGAVESRDNDYFGQPLNRLTRLIAAGHGGQILLSEVTQELIRDRLPVSVSLLSLGEHLLKDLSRPEHIYQIVHPDLPAQFPPLKTLDNPELPNNLPQQFTSFIGREKEIGEVKQLLEKTRLLTVMGTGGAGKTRLCLQVAADTLESYHDGIWFIELAALTDPALVPQTVMETVGAREQPGRPYIQTLLDYLKTRTILLILDNCEHLVTACAQLVNGLLRSCPGVKILASSREGLNVPGEQVYRIPSLSLPPFASSSDLPGIWEAPTLIKRGAGSSLPQQEGRAGSNQDSRTGVERREAGAVTVETLIEYESVRLFIERATLCKPDFAVNVHNAPALAQVCYRLDGIPLAIELAAARIRSLSVEEINARLDNRFRLLTNSNRNVLPRQQTLRALIDWSYDLLSAQERLLLHRLSVFAGGWTLEAAEHVCVGEDPVGDGIEDWEMLDLLTGLVDKSLVFTEQRAGSMRYRLLETVRQYASERLKESGAADEVRDRHLDHFRQLAAEAFPHLNTLESPVWNKRLNVEHDNLRAALDHALSAPERAGMGLDLVGYLWNFWQNVGHLREGKRLMLEALKTSEHFGRTSERAWALTGAAAISWGQGDYADARAFYEECLAIQRELGSIRGIANAFYNYGDFLNLTGDFATARACMEEGLALHEQALHKQIHVGLYANLAETLAWQGEYDEARFRLERILNAVSKAGHSGACAEYTGFLARIALAQGDLPLAERRMSESLDWTLRCGSIREMLFALYGAAGLALAQGHWERAVRLYAAHDCQRERLALPLQPVFHREYEQALDTLRGHLSAEAFAVAWQSGEALTPQQAMEVAQGLL